MSENKALAQELRELPFEELAANVDIRDWPEALNIHHVINAVADWIERKPTNPYRSQA